MCDVSLLVLQESRAAIADTGLTPKHLAEIVSLIDRGVISGKIAKDILPNLLAGQQGSRM